MPWPFRGSTPEAHRFEEGPQMRKLEKVLAADVEDRRYRWRAAMLRVWDAGNVLVGVSKALNVTVFTARDSTPVARPRELARALAEADDFARTMALRAGHQALSA
jgi:hypothetical protein